MATVVKLCNTGSTTQVTVQQLLKDGVTKIVAADQTRLPNNLFMVYEDWSRATRIALANQHDDPDWKYTVIPVAGGFAIRVTDNDGYELGVL